MSAVSLKSDQVFRSGGDSSGVFPLPAPASWAERQLVLAHVSRISLAQENRIESRTALRGNYTLGGSQASENIALTRYDGLAMLQCVSITTAHNIVRQCNASWGKFSMALLDALAHVVLEYWHTAALFLKFFTASQCNSSCLRLSNIEVHGRK